MEDILLIVLLIFAVAGIFTAASLLNIPYLGNLGSGNMHNNMRNIVAAQRQTMQGLASGLRRSSSLYETAAKADMVKTASSKLTLRKRLKYAQWRMPPLAFHLMEIGLSIVVFVLVSMVFTTLLKAISILSGPLFMRWLLNLAMDRRFKAFDSDYPQFLLSLVGLLKTGMNTMPAIDAAAQALEEGSLLKHEVILMNERLRFGVSEDKSIGSFGEDIFHPEIELFVQALLLSRRVGGNLSDTLDRLAKQVRKRQFFRASAAAAVGMQRGSIWIIIAILVALEGYLWFVYPSAVVGAWSDSMGWEVWNFGIVVILIGIWWVRQVTKIRV